MVYEMLGIGPRPTQLGRHSTNCSSQIPSLFMQLSKGQVSSPQHSRCCLPLTAVSDQGQSQRNGSSVESGILTPGQGARCVPSPQYRTQEAVLDSQGVASHRAMLLQQALYVELYHTRNLQLDAQGGLL